MLALYAGRRLDPAVWDIGHMGYHGETYREICCSRLEAQRVLEFIRCVSGLIPTGVIHRGQTECYSAPLRLLGRFRSAMPMVRMMSVSLTRVKCSRLPTAM
jgi:hypothetical protein